MIYVSFLLGNVLPSVNENGSFIKLVFCVAAWSIYLADGVLENFHCI